MSIVVLVSFPDPFRMDCLNLEEMIIKENEDREMEEEKGRERRDKQNIPFMTPVSYFNSAPIVNVFPTSQ